ncbi:hypothetical protein, partial [Klebsiella aerogenes]|uniref:hypothetical protein n=1 Tax=Klebsiella aerogenes TaxID=548 RepID=UPI001954FF1A
RQVVDEFVVGTEPRHAKKHPVVAASGSECLPDNAKLIFISASGLMPSTTTPRYNENKYSAITTEYN